MSSRPAEPKGRPWASAVWAGGPDLIRRYLELGARYVSTGNDISFLSAAAAQKREQFA